MKVRHKQSGAKYDKLGEFNGYWVLHRSCAELPFIAIPIDYEPIPEVTWRDVSQEVQIREDSHLKHHHVPGGVFHGAKQLAQLVCGGGYRLRKVDVYHSISSGLNGLSSAFIIEKEDA